MFFIWQVVIVILLFLKHLTLICRMTETFKNHRNNSDGLITLWITERRVSELLSHLEPWPFGSGYFSYFRWFLPRSSQRKILYGINFWKTLLWWMKNVSEVLIFFLSIYPNHTENILELSCLKRRYQFLVFINPF